MKILESEYPTFDDVLLVPQYSRVDSRSSIDTTTSFMGTTFKTPILSANMDTITTDIMANKMLQLDARGVLHRFQSIEQNVEMFKKSPEAWCSFGIAPSEIVRVDELYRAGCKKFVLDVAHGASDIVLKQYRDIRMSHPEPDVFITVGNFATSESILTFVKKCIQTDVMVPNAFKVGIGGGSMCTTRIVTGSGVPQLYSLVDCVSTGYNIIADGGIRNSGDYAKALATGCKAVMIGGMFAGTEETPGVIVNEPPRFDIPHTPGKFKKYRGSASQESYEIQKKETEYRTPEGESTLVPYKGSVENVVQQLQAGLKSSMSYSNSFNLKEFKNNAIMIKVSGHTQQENKAHGVKG